MDCFQQSRVVNFAQAVKIKAASVAGLKTERGFRLLALFGPAEAA
jgi:hypothetical protein